MIVKEFEQGTPAWHEWRKGKITGSKVKNLIPKRKSKKAGYYDLVADLLSVELDDDPFESPIDRGHRLEPEAREKFMKLTGKHVDEVGGVESDLDSSIAISPDGLIPNKDGEYKEAIEIKCLSSGNHMKAYITQEIPTEYIEQIVQYFVVLDTVETVYVTFYDPRIPSKDLFFIEAKRKDYTDQIEKQKVYMLKALEEVRKIKLDITF